jgi:hypothetical protein
MKMTLRNHHSKVPDLETTSVTLQKSLPSRSAGTAHGKQKTLNLRALVSACYLEYIILHL